MKKTPLNNVESTPNLDLV